MAVSGPRYLTAVSTLVGGTGTWANATVAQLNSDNAAYAVWTKPTGTGQASPGLQCSGFGAFAGVSVSDTITSVLIEVNAFVSSTTRQAAFTYELWDGTNAIIGSAQTGANTTTISNIDSFTISGVTYAQLQTLQLRVYAHGGSSSTSGTSSVDYVRLSVNYTPVPAPDSGTGLDSGQVTVLASDAGSGLDSGLSVVVSDTDSGAGLDLVWWLWPGGEYGYGTDTESVNKGGGISAISSQDAGGGAESQGIAASLSSLDAGSGAELQVVSGRTIADSDAGSGADAEGVRKTLFGIEQAAGDDEESVAAVAPPSADSGAGRESGAVNAPTLAVTATQGGDTLHGIALRVKIMHGLAYFQDGASAASTGSCSTTITTTTPGSQVYGAISSGASGPGDPDTGTTFIDDYTDVVNGQTYVSFTADPGDPGDIAVGGSGMDAHADVAAFELLPAGTITEDPAGTQFVADAASTFVSTAVFTAPLGSYLVALVSSNGTAAGVTTMAVSDSYGLAWREVANTSSTISCYAGVWIALVTTTTPSAADSGSGTEGALSVGVSSADSGAGADGSALRVSSPDADSGAGDDEALLLAQVHGADAGTGISAVSEVSVQVILAADAGSGADAAQALASIADADAGSGYETVVIRVASADAGTSGEGQRQEFFGVFLIFDYDTGHIQEGGIEAAADGDAGLGAEAWFAGIVGQEFASGSDTGGSFIAFGVPSDSDSGSGSDLWTTSAIKLESEAASGSEDSDPRMLASADYGTLSSSELVLPVGVFPFPPPWLFLPGGGMRLKPSRLQRARLVFRPADAFLVSSSDSAVMADGQNRPAYVSQYATAVLVTCGVPS